MLKDLLNFPPIIVQKMHRKPYQILHQHKLGSVGEQEVSFCPLNKHELIYNTCLCKHSIYSNTNMKIRNKKGGRYLQRHHRSLE